MAESRADLNLGPAHLFEGLQIPDDEQLRQILLHLAQSEVNPTEATFKAGPENKVQHVGTLTSPVPFKITPKKPNLNTTPWARQNQKRLQRALGIDHNKPGPRAGRKKGKIFDAQLKAARGCPLKMAKVRKAHRHLFEWNCRRAMVERVQVAFQRLLTAPDPALAANDPLVSLDVQFARLYYDIDLVALATSS